MHIEWPDATPDRVYSPSSVIREFFESGDRLSIAEFETQITRALTRARERVREVYGMECTAASAELQRVQAALQTFQDDATDDAGGTVTIQQLSSTPDVQASQGALSRRSRHT